jgi:hypothetical protein
VEFLEIMNSERETFYNLLDQKVELKNTELDVSGMSLDLITKELLKYDNPVLLKNIPLDKQAPADIVKDGHLTCQKGDTLLHIIIRNTLNHIGAADLINHLGLIHKMLRIICRTNTAVLYHKNIKGDLFTADLFRKKP